MIGSLARYRESLAATLVAMPVRRELIMLFLILAESMILYIYAGVALAELDTPHSPLPFLLIFGLLYVARVAPAALRHWRVWSPQYELIMGAILVASFLLLVKVAAFPAHPLLDARWITGAIDDLILRPSDAARSVWGLTLFTAFAWWRGRTRTEPVIDSAYGMLRWGILLTGLGIALVWLTAPLEAGIRDNISPAVTGFLISSLFAIGLARQTFSGEEHAGSLAIWIVLLGLPTLIIGATTVSAAGVLTGDALHFLQLLVRPVLWLTELLISVAIVIVIVVLFLIIMPLIWVIERYDFAFFTSLESLDLGPRSLEDLENAARMSFEVADPIRYLAAGGIIMLLAWGLIRFRYRRRKIWQPWRRPEDRATAQELDADASLLRRALRLLGVFREPFRGDDLPGGRRWAHTRRIRILYRQFLRIMSQHDLPRPSYQTPAEFARDIAQHHLQATDPVWTLTHAYNQTRYAGRPASQEEAERTEQALRAVREQLAHSTHNTQ